MVDMKRILNIVELIIVFRFILFLFMNMEVIVMNSVGIELLVVMNVVFVMFVGICSLKWVKSILNIK